ncbi:MAG: hypothetical protein P1P82_16040 [Bacteroidales bacterium]|nr:hypothetical protein [Bacteroidales bacterium]
MKNVIIALFFVAFTSALFAQEAPSEKALYLEIGGSGIAASLNYEHNIWIRNSNAFSLRAGLGYFPMILNTEFSAGTVSAIAGAYFSRKFNSKHALSIGISNAFTSTVARGISDDFNSLRYSQLIVPSIGYRYQSPEKHKVFWGIGYSPLISYDGISVENQLFQFKNHFYLILGLNL